MQGRDGQSCFMLWMVEAACLLLVGSGTLGRLDGTVDELGKLGGCDGGKDERGIGGGIHGLECLDAARESVEGRRKNKRQCDASAGQVFESGGNPRQGA